MIKAQHNRISASRQLSGVAGWLSCEELCSGLNPQSSAYLVLRQERQALELGLGDYRLNQYQ